MAHGLLVQAEQLLQDSQGGTVLLTLSLSKEAYCDTGIFSIRFIVAKSSLL
jgi:hypothetical protein